MFYTQTEQEVLEQMASSHEGLNNQKVQTRLSQYGYNELSSTHTVPLWQLFLENFKDPLIIILLIAAGIQIFLGERIEAIIILVVVLLNATLGVIQTRKAESSLDSLKKLSAPLAKVLRDGKKVTIPVRELVPGDVVLLEAGDYVPADGRLLETQTLKVEEGMLTGESEPVLKHTEVIKKEVGLGDQRNMVFSGATVVYGRGKMIITQTGMHTEVGKIATLIETAGNKQTPLQHKLERFGKKLGVVIMLLALLIFLVEVWRGYINGMPLKGLFLDSFMFAIAVAVAAIPEALSSIVTIVLAMGTKEMARHKAIVRKLPAVETLGSTGVICTDKTGTLTQNKMTVVDFYMYGVKEKQNGEENEKVQEIDQERALLVSAALCNDADITHEDKEIGDPTEVALLHFATERGVDYKNIRTSYDRLSELPFDSDRKLMSTVCSIQGDAIMFIKGAPDVILSRCSYGLDNGKLVKLSHEMRLAYKKQIEAFSDRALRVLAFAIKDVPDDGFVPCLEDEEDMTLIGLTAMIDPPRKEVYEAVASAKKAGIRPIMITGDHKTTAAAIAREIGIMREGDKALTGQELDALTEEELNKDLEKISVYARVSPENKIRIVKAWQQKGKVTAMTGDGVNDAPALKQADIGIGMGSGTDVAKDASAMVLTDDNFATIVTAVKIGRSVYSNIKKTITYLFAGNLGAILAILFAVFANLPSPFTALQLLFINLINDSLPAIALGLEPPEKNIMDYSPRETNEGILVGGTWQAIVSKGFVIAIVVVIAQYLGQKDSPQMGVAMAFTTVTLTRILQTLSARSNETPFIKLGLFSNLYVLGAMAVCFCLYGVVLLPGIREIFKIPVNFGVFAWLVCLGLSLLGLLGMECLKVGYNYKQRHDAR